jgi:hypothetical protein
LRLRGSSNPADLGTSSPRATTRATRRKGTHARARRWYDLSCLSLFTFRFVLSFKEGIRLSGMAWKLFFSFSSSSPSASEGPDSDSEEALGPACVCVCMCMCVCMCVRVGASEGGPVGGYQYCKMSCSFRRFLFFFFSSGKERTIAVQSLIMSFWNQKPGAARFAPSHRYDLTPGV